MAAFAPQILAVTLVPEVIVVPATIYENKGIGYFAPQQSLIININAKTAGNRFARLDSNSTAFDHGFDQHSPIQTQPIEEIKITVERSTGGAWSQGTMLYGEKRLVNGIQKLTLRIIAPTAENAGVGWYGQLTSTIDIADALAGTPESEKVTGIALDENAGRPIVGTSVICTTSHGRVFKITPGATPVINLLTTVFVDIAAGKRAWLEACFVMPNDAATIAKYGTRIAGRILVGADHDCEAVQVNYDNKGLWSIDPNLTSQTPDRILNEPVEDIDLVRPGENYYLNDAIGALYGFHSSQFSNLTGDLILVVENTFVAVDQGEIRRLLRTISTYSTEVLLSNSLSGGSFPSQTGGLEHGMFAPVDISNGSKPTVSVILTPSSLGSISEAAGQTSSYRISRSGSTTAPLLVRFMFQDTLANNALPGSDFQFTTPINAPMSITLDPGVSSVDIPIQPLPDSLVEGSELAVLTLLPSFSYNVSANQFSQPISITDSTIPTLPPVLTFSITPVYVASGLNSDSYAFAVNSAGEVAGQYKDTYPYGANPFKGYFRSATGTYSVPVQGWGGYQIWPYGIDDSGVMVGGRFVDYNNPVSADAFKWSVSGGLTWLTGIPNVYNGQPLAYAVNNSGIIVGQARNAQAKLRAVKWNFAATSAQDLSSLAGGGLVDSSAFGINSSGKVVGRSGIPGSPAIHAFRASSVILPIGEGTSDLGTPQDIGNSEAYDINDGDEVVGQASFLIGGVAQLRGFYRGAGEGASQGFRNLGVLVTGNASSGRSINNHGHIVGWSRTTGSSNSNRAVLWLNNGQMRDLNDTALVSPLTGWFLAEAEDIGDQGHIVGWGTLNGIPRAFLLTPNTLNY